MKNKFLVVCLMSLLSATSMYAYAGPKAGGEGFATVIRDFIDSHMKGNYKELSRVLDNNYTLKIPRGNKVIQQDKSSLVDAMKKEAGTEQNCQSNYEVLAKSDALVIARVDFSYHDSIQHNYLILEKNDEQEWKITQVCKMFEDLETPTGGSGAVAAKN